MISISKPTCSVIWILFNLVPIQESFLFPFPLGQRNGNDEVEEIPATQPDPDTPVVPEKVQRRLEWQVLGFKSPGFQKFCVSKQLCLRKR